MTKSLATVSSALASNLFRHPAVTLGLAAISLGYYIVSESRSGRFSVNRDGLSFGFEK